MFLINSLFVFIFFLSFSIYLTHSFKLSITEKKTVLAYLSLAVGLFFFVYVCLSFRFYHHNAYSFEPFTYTARQK